MIGFPKNIMKKQGNLFILWGWLLLFTSLIRYIEMRVVYSFLAENIMKIFIIILPVIVVTFTGYYLVEISKDKSGRSTRKKLYYLWISLIGCMILINLIQYNVLHQINFKLQHPLFMAVTALAIIMTGAILKFYYISLGGVLFGLLALAASYLELPEQLLIESLAWFIAFVIPGYVLNYKVSMKKQALNLLTSNIKKSSYNDKIFNKIKFYLLIFFQLYYKY